MQARAAAWKASGESIGFVPTMGALHEGHLSLIEKARERTTRTVASIFVNPTQFGPGEDFDTYPRREEEDIRKLAGVNCDAVYLPLPEEIYPEGSTTNVRVEALSDLLDGVYRPHFFYGVTSVVCRLFLHVQPDIAVFGEKDYQQLQIIRQMVRDLGFPIVIIPGPTMRDSDGLARSSRNLYLTPDERRRAGALFAALHRARVRLSLGASPRETIAEAERLLRRSGFEKIDYIELVDPVTLTALPDEPLTKGQEARILAAAWMGSTRLIDNISVLRQIP